MSTIITFIDDDMYFDITVWEFIPPPVWVFIPSPDVPIDPSLYPTIPAKDVPYHVVYGVAGYRRRKQEEVLKLRRNILEYLWDELMDMVRENNEEVEE